MNKLFVVCVAVAAVAASMALVKADQVDQVLNQMEAQEVDEGYSYAAGEGSGLGETTSQEQAYFRDFCTNAQDEIKTFLKAKLVGTASEIYTVMLTQATDAGREVLQAQLSDIKKGSEVIAEAAAKTEQNGQAESTEERVEETVQVIERSMISSIVGTIKKVVSAIVETARTALFSQLDELKASLGADGLRDRIENACASVSFELQPRLATKFAEAKREIQQATSKAPNAAELKPLLAGARIDTIGCSLTDRVNKVAKFCDILKLVGGPLYQLVGIN